MDSSSAIEQKPRYAWKERTYVVPSPSRRGIRLKASALRGLRRFVSRPTASDPATVVVPPFYNLLPAEAIAMGWLNEIDALHTIRQRMNVATRVAGWDVFTFHTLHNLDRYFDSTISTVCDTWANEGSLSRDAVQASRRRFRKPYDYHLLQARLVENLVLQSSIMNWISARAESLPLQFHIVGGALLSALVWSNSIRLEDAVASAAAVGARWDQVIRSMAEESSDAVEPGWRHFATVRRLIEGRDSLKLAVSRDDLPRPEAPSQPFWFSPEPAEDPVRIETSRDAALALESLNTASLSCSGIDSLQYPISGWLMSPAHAMARSCRWSVSRYLLATPASVTLFLDNVAGIGLQPVLAETAADQNRLRLSRMKVTGP